MLFLGKWNQGLRQCWWVMCLICINTLMGHREQTGYFFVSLRSLNQQMSGEETDGERDPGCSSSSQQLFTPVKSYQCEILVIQVPCVHVVLCRALLRLRRRLMAPLWTSWGLYCLSWIWTVWLWWTEKHWLCGWRRWEASVFLKRLWEILVPCSLTRIYLGKGSHPLEKTLQHPSYDTLASNMSDMPQGLKSL